MIETFPDLIYRAAEREPGAVAIRHKGVSTSYEELARAVTRVGSSLRTLGIERNDRVGIFADKEFATVVAMFATCVAGGAFVPINSLFKPKQVAYILGNCNIRILFTTRSRLRELTPILAACPDLQHIVLLDDESPEVIAGGPVTHGWQSLEHANASAANRRVISSDMAAIMYTSGSTGSPKGVVLSHTNLTIGAESVANYLENSAEDRILSVLPLSFDAGLSQLSTGFHAGACVVLHNYFLARDVVRLVERERITGITGVPPLWMQLTEQDWPAGSTDSVRYFANTGGKMPRETLSRLRKVFPRAAPFLMYGLTEAFRSTYLPPSDADARPDSIGKAIPNAEVLVVRDDGSLCEPMEVGELVHRGPLVSLGYWNDPERTAIRFKPSPCQPSGIPHPELAVWSGDLVRRDADGFLYFVGRKDDMIKTSGYRVSPSEIEEIAFGSRLVAEVVAVGVDDARLGQVIVLVAKATADQDDPTEALLAHIKSEAPNYMLPAAIHWQDNLPRNANGKLDRRAIVASLAVASADDAA